MQKTHTTVNPKRAGLDVYPLGDDPTGKELESLFGRYIPVDDRFRERLNIHAVFTGEKRCPKAGEWYLSGASVEAYRAANDLSMPYHIARLVRTKTETVTTVCP